MFGGIFNQVSHWVLSQLSFKSQRPPLSPLQLSALEQLEREVSAHPECWAYGDMFFDGTTPQLISYTRQAGAYSFAISQEHVGSGSYSYTLTILRKGNTILREKDGPNAQKLFEILYGNLSSCGIALPACFRPGTGVIQ